MLKSKDYKKEKPKGSIIERYLQMNKMKMNANLMQIASKIKIENNR